MFPWIAKIGAPTFEASCCFGDIKSAQADGMNVYGRFSWIGRRLTQEM